MDQFDNLRRTKTKTDTMSGMFDHETMNMRENVAYMEQDQQFVQRSLSFEPVENEVEQNLNEQIRINLEEKQIIEKDKLIPPQKEEIEKAHRQLGVKMPSSPVKRANRIKRSKVNYDRRQEFINAKKTFAEEKSAGQNEITEDNLAKQKKTDWEDFKSLASDPDLIDNLFSKKKGETADEFLIKNYKEISQKLSCLDNARAMMNETNDESMKEFEPQLKTLTEIKRFYDLRGKLVSNKYYTMLPEEEVQKLSYKELKAALLKEYGKKEGKNEELIHYYETVIKLKNCEIKDKKSAKDSWDGEKEEKKEEINKQGTSEHEVEKIADGFADFMMAVEADKFRVSPAEKWRQYKVFFDVVDKDIQRYLFSKGFKSVDESENVKKLLDMHKRYQANPTLSDDVLERSVDEHMKEDEDLKDETRLQKGAGSGIALSEDQKEGLRQVQSWLLRHATEKHWYRRHSKTLKKSQNAFALRVVQMPPEQQLLVFYLMENNIQSDGDPSHFYAALKDYVPNKAAFKGSVNWDTLSSAVRQTSKTAGYIEEYANIEANVKVFRETRERADADQGENAVKDKKAALFGEFASHYSMIALLCQSAGFGKDADPDLIEDKKLRARIKSELEQINELLKELRNMGVEESEADEKKEKSADQLKEKAFMEAIDQYLPKENTVKGGLEFVGGTGAVIGATVAYAMTMHEAFFGILELGFALYSAANIRLSSPTTAEQGAVAMNTIGSLLSGIGNTVVPFGTVLSTIAETAGNTAAELGGKLAAHMSGQAVMTEAQLAETMAGQTMAETTATTAYQAAQPIFQAGGALVMIAGAAKMFSQGINIHRANQNMKSAEKTEQQLEKQTQGRTLNKDERRLKRFVKHRKEGIKEEKRSAGLSMVSGAITMVSGAMMMTGVLAPLAMIPMLIGMGIDIANAVVGSKRQRMKRKNAVDTYLQMDKMVEKVKSEHPYDWVREMKTEELKDKLRTEMLAELGFSSYHECYKELIIGDAKLLYHKAFVDDSIKPEEREMYEEAIKSLGFKIAKADVGDPDGENKPTIQMMVAKLMK